MAVELTIDNLTESGGADGAVCVRGLEYETKDSMKYTSEVHMFPSDNGVCK